MRVRSLAARCAGVRSHIKSRLSARRRGLLVAALAALALASAATAATPAIAAGARVQAPSAAAASTKWHSQHVPSGLDTLHLQSVSCAKDGKHCMTGGIFCPPGGCGGLISFAVLATTNGGKTWKKRSLPKNLGDIGSISCGSTKFCVAPATKGPLGSSEKESFLVTKNGGSSWKVVSTPSNEGIGDVSCPSATTCFASSYISPNGVIDKTTNGGSHWTSKKAPAYASKISCASTSHCVALAAGGFMYTTNGSSWHLVAAPGAPTLSAITCVSSSACYAAGENASDTAFVVLVTANGGKSWKTKTLPSGIDLVGGIACASAKRCVVDGDITKNGKSNRVIFTTTNGGSKWTKPRLPTGTGTLQAVWCSAKSYCLATGSYLKYSGTSPTGNGPYILAN
jgi:photosystem II stability/assembly factor-like uncharacterized protein